ncbi:MAG: ABC-2 transporter permease [Clostridiales bacterium]|nr:ABC-2 transporter permease [Clostridiales bacterium]
MKALIIKDIYQLQKTVKIILALMIFYAILFLLTGATDALPLTLVILGITLPISTFTFDEANKWDRYALSGPLPRKAIVRSKYLLNLLMMAAALLISLFCLFVLHFFVYVRPWLEILIMLGMEIIIGLLGISVILPLIYKLGAERGRLLLIAALMIPVLTVIIFSKFAPPPLQQFVIYYLAYFPIVLSCLAVVGYYISYRISLKIYLKKDF